jgi:hypothetical protein
MFIPITCKVTGAIVWVDYENGRALHFDMRGGTFCDDNIGSIQAQETPEQIAAMVNGTSGGDLCSVVELDADALAMIARWGQIVRERVGFSEYEGELLGGIEGFLGRACGEMEG